jgi:Fe-S-cluster containining protein
MNCDSCLLTCRAACCRGPIPMLKETFAAHTPIRPVTKQMEHGENIIVMHVAENGEQVCPFLGMDDKCSIYGDRPELCRKFGDESHIMMTCSFQAKDGRIRSRQERRKVQRDQDKDAHRIIAQR